ncbi:MAG: amidohydrolase family protein [Phycisphaerales bacterium]
MRTTLITATLAALATLAPAQDLTHKAPPQDHPIFIVGATVHTVSGDTLDDAVVSFADGKIAIIADREIMQRVRLTADTEVIDAEGMHLYPGLVCAESQLGLTEISAVRAMDDYNEVGQFTPEVRAAVSVNPDSTLIPVARTNGVLTFGSFPTGGRVPGRPSVMTADGWTWEDMALDDAFGLVINYPRVRPFDRAFPGGGGRFGAGDDQEENIARDLRQLDEFFASAEAYVAALTADPDLPHDLRYDAMRPVLASAGVNQEPVFINADDIDQITSAVAWAVGRGLKPIIVGGRDAPLAADLLKTHDVPVIVNGINRMPKRDDSPYDDSYTLPERLSESGVRWCLSSADETGHIRTLPDEAGRTVAFGLSPADALASITLWPAQILGVADKIGSIEKDKLATLILTDGDILETTSVVKRAWIEGREIDLSNKQTKLRDKYRDKYEQMGAIKGDD